MSEQTTSYSPEVEQLLDQIARDRRSDFLQEPKRPKIVQGPNFAIAVSLECRKRGTHEYTAILCAGVWPTDEVLCDVCDGNYPHSHNFGGSVSVLSPLRKAVWVYVD